MHRVTIKRRWTAFFIIFLVSLLVCVSCGSGESGSPGSDSKNATGEESSQPSPDYSNKTKLVYLVPNDNKPGWLTIRRINEALDEQGAPYYIVFQGLPWSDQNTSIYGAAVRKNVESADLLFTGWPGGDYIALAEEDLLLCLDEYLASEEGKSLYEALPADNWYAITVGKSVYGVSGYPYVKNTPPSYTANRGLMEKYKITEEDLSKPLYELEDVIRRVYEGEKGTKGFTPIHTTPSDIDRFVGEKPISSSVTLNEETGQAHLLLENPEYVKWLKTLYDFYRKGYVAVATGNNIENLFLSVRFATDMPTELADGGRYESDDDVEGRAVDIAVEGYAGYSGELNLATAVSVKSTNQEYALDFLTRLFTDSYLTNLMILGAGYERELDSDGRRNPDMLADNLLMYGNYYISAPSYYDYVDMKDKYFEFHNKLKKSRFTGFRFDSAPVEEQIWSADAAFMSCLRELFRTEQDFDTCLSEWRQRLLEAGAQEVVDEANRQLCEFRAEE